MKTLKWVLLCFCLFGALGYAYWKFAIPTHRTSIHSELVMLGDLDGDNQWTVDDLAALDAILKDPFTVSNNVARRIDINQNGMIDEEDIRILRMLVASSGDPYAAEEMARLKNESFPRPRELYRYISVEEYQPRPLFALSHPHAADSVLDWITNQHPPSSTSTYSETLAADIYSEAIRFDYAWRKRKSQLLPIEREYAMRKLDQAKKLFLSGAQYELLLALIELVEDAETFTVQKQPDFPLQLLTFRDHLREILNSPDYAEFKAGKKNWRIILKTVSNYLQRDLGLTYDFETLGPPRNLTHLANYLQRAEWQYYKSTARENDFRRIIAYAQHDARYLRASARTSKRLQDTNLENHNLPMLLLFREALRIKNGDKKKAVGLLDEAIRVPYSWVKSIPREALPSSLALDNFLLPGNKEDGADKSRHWNVFGGICLFKSPQDALDLALKREVQDLRENNYSEEAMREFLRDMISNLNGMYHVMTINPDLLVDRP